MRVLLICFLGLAPLVTACTTPYTYVSYEVVRVITELHQGDEVHVVRKDGESFRGTIVSIDAPNVSVATESAGNQNVHWDDIRVIERMRHASVRVE